MVVRFHSGCAVLLHLLRDVAVNVQGERGRSVAQIALYGLNVVAGVDRCNGVRVSEIVEPGIWPSDGGGELLEFPVYGGLIQRSANFIGEYKVAFVPYSPGL